MTIVTLLSGPSERYYPGQVSVIIWAKFAATKNGQLRPDNSIRNFGVQVLVFLKSERSF